MSATVLTSAEIRCYCEARIENLQLHGKQLRAPCPLHKGKRDSLTINTETGLWTCHQEDRHGNIFQLEEALSRTDKKKAYMEVLRIVGRSASGNGTQPRQVAQYDYVDEQGNVLFQCVRYEPKDFRQRRKDGSGWTWNLGSVRRVLYNLPTIIAAPLVFVVEGEKDVETLKAFGLAATCNSGGAGKWNRDEYNDSLRGKDVVIIPDNDDRGKAHGKDVAKKLRGIANSVKTVTLPNGKDVSDWVEAGGTDEELIRLVEATSAHIAQKTAKVEMPQVLNCADLLAIPETIETMLFEGYPLPACGLTLKVGGARAGKTVLAVQEMIAVASGKSLFDNYRALQSGPVMIVEMDDPAGDQTIKTILTRSGVDAKLPFHFVAKVPFGIGPGLLEWLEQEIVRLDLRMVVLDSYTAMRGPRSSSNDIVKTEHEEFTGLDALGKRLHRSIQLIHHGSKGSAGLDWTQEAAGTFVMSMASEAQTHVSRFGDLEPQAPERLVRIRGRHAADVQLILRFIESTLNYEFVLEGGAAGIYPAMQEMKAHMGTKTFSPKELIQATGMSRATAHRHLTRLWQANVLTKRGFGEYSFAS